MVRRQKTKKEMEVIGYLIAERLKARAQVDSSVEIHLDDDTICSFIEGRLGEAESSPVVSHLVDCSSCRNATAQLVRLESQITDEPLAVRTPDSSSSRLNSFFAGLAERIIPSSEEDVVFAYQSPEGVPDQEKESEVPSGPASTAQTEIASEPEGPAKNSEIDK